MGGNPKKAKKAKSRATWIAQQGAAVFLNKYCDIFFLEGHQSVTLLKQTHAKAGAFKIAGSSEMKLKSDRL